MVIPCKNKLPVQLREVGNVVCKKGPALNCCITQLMFIGEALVAGIMCSNRIASSQSQGYGYGFRDIFVKVTAGSWACYLMDCSCSFSIMSFSISS